MYYKLDLISSDKRRLILKRTIYNFLIIGFLLLNQYSQALSSGHFDDSIQAELTSLLENRYTPVTDHESLEAQLVRYVQGDYPNMKFFSHPAKFHQNWKNLLEEHDKQPVTKEIFLALGRLQQAVLNNGQEEYYAFAGALNQGITRILQGDLGFRKTPMQESERDIFAKELLVSGRSLGSRVWDRTDQLGFHYVVASDLKEKRHLQISALLMLAGHDRTLIDDSGWYFKDMNEADKVRLLTWVYGCADRLPARFEAGSVDFQIEEYANNAEFLKPFKGREKQQLKYALRDGFYNYLFANRDVFPDREYLSEAETILENLKTEIQGTNREEYIENLDCLILFVFGGRKDRDWSEFLKFSTENKNDVRTTIHNFMIYNYYPDLSERADFIKFYDNYLKEVAIGTLQPNDLKYFLQACSNFSDTSERDKFVNFCRHYFRSIKRFKPVFKLKEIYDQLLERSGILGLQPFISFSMPYLVGLTERRLADLFDIYNYSKIPENKEKLNLEELKNGDNISYFRACIPFLSNPEQVDSFNEFWNDIFSWKELKYNDECANVILNLQDADAFLDDEEKRSMIETFIEMSEEYNAYFKKDLAEPLREIVSSYNIFIDESKRKKFLRLIFDYISVRGYSPLITEFEAGRVTAPR